MNKSLMAFCRPLARRSHKAASTFTPLGFSFSHIGGSSGPHVKHCQELQRLHKTGISPYMAPTPSPTFNLVLWHEDVYPTDPGHLTDYLNEILGFAHYLQKNENIPTRMMLTLSNDPKLNTGTLLTQIANTMASALSEGLTIGFQLDSYTIPMAETPPVLAALDRVVKKIASAAARFSYIVSFDSEAFSPAVTAKTASTFALDRMADLGTVGITPPPTNIAVIGGAAGIPTWTPPLINVFELYSGYNWNEIITKETNQPSTCWNSLKTSTGYPHTIDNFPTTSSSKDYVPGWFAFSVECCSNPKAKKPPCSQSHCSCLSSKYLSSSTPNLCGSANVFGTNTRDGGGWTLSSFLDFLHIAAKDLKGTPTFVLYQSGLLPMSWLSETKDPLNFLFG